MVAANETAAVSPAAPQNDLNLEQDTTVVDGRRDFQASGAHDLFHAGQMAALQRAVDLIEAPEHVRALFRDLLAAPEDIRAVYQKLLEAREAVGL